MMGLGLITSEEEYWKRHRKMVQPIFYKEQMAAVIKLMIDSTDERVARWKNILMDSGFVEVKAEMIDHSVAIIMRSLFGNDADSYIADFKKNIAIEYEFVMKRNRTLLLIPVWFPTFKNYRFKKARKKLDDIIYEMIDKRKGKATNDILSMLLSAKDEEGLGMADSEIRDELLTMFIAGHDTTAFSLSFTLYLLAKHTAVQQKLKEEVNSVLKGGAITFEKLKGMSFLKAVINESLRMYPSVWTLARQAIAEDEIGGYKIPKNSFMFLRRRVQQTTVFIQYIINFFQQSTTITIRQMIITLIIMQLPRQCWLCSIPILLSVSAYCSTLFHCQLFFI